MKKKIFFLPLLILAVCLFMACKRSVPLPADTIRWIYGTYAISTETAGGSVFRNGGFEKNEYNEQAFRSLLSKNWGITDRAGADENLDWLLTTGHRSEFLKQYEYYELDSFSEEELDSLLSEISEKDAEYFRFLLEPYAEFEVHAIDAWDYCRAVQLLAQCYLAGYYTEDEALDASLEIAKLLQKTYDSWRDMADSYLYGYQYWSGENLKSKDTDAYSRVLAYRKVREIKNSPYDLDWDMELRKEW